MAKGTLANMRSKSKSIAVRFEERTFKRLNSIAESRGISFAQLIRDAVEFWDKGPKK